MFLTWLEDYSHLACWRKQETLPSANKAIMPQQNISAVWWWQELSYQLSLEALKSVSTLLCYVILKIMLIWPDFFHLQDLVLIEESTFPGFVPPGSGSLHDQQQLLTFSAGWKQELILPPVYQTWLPSHMWRAACRTEMPSCATLILGQEEHTLHSTSAAFTIR